jgi:hypothetical protein
VCGFKDGLWTQARTVPPPPPPSPTGTFSFSSSLFQMPRTPHCGPWWMAFPNQLLPFAGLTLATESKSQYSLTLHKLQKMEMSLRKARRAGREMRQCQDYCIFMILGRICVRALCPFSITKWRHFFPCIPCYSLDLECAPHVPCVKDLVSKRCY